MPKRKKRIDLEDPLRDLEKIVHRLADNQGMVARRNARAALFAELRRVKTWVDTTYPSKTTRKPKRGPKSVQELEREGWTIVGEIPPNIAAAGIKPKTAIHKKGKKSEQCTLLPGWAVELFDKHPNCTVWMLKQARRSVAFRKEVLMENRFRERREEGKSPLGLKQRLPLGLKQRLPLGLKHRLQLVQEKQSA